MSATNPEQKQDRRKVLGIPLIILALLLLIAVGVVLTNVINQPKSGTTEPREDNSAIVPTEEAQEPDPTDDISTDEPTATHTDTPTSTVTPTATATATATQPLVEKGPTSSTDICANNGGTANVTEICTCQGLIDRVTFCGDGTKFDVMMTTPCTPDPSQCQQTGGDGGGETCTLTVQQCNDLGFSSVDPVTCTCYGNYKP